MPIFKHSTNSSNPFVVSQPNLSASERTSHLKYKTKYNALVAQSKRKNIEKQNGAVYTEPGQTSSSNVSSALSHHDLLEITKGKYLLTPPYSELKGSDLL